MGKVQYIYRFVLGIRLGARAKKEYSCFQKYGWREKLLPGGRNLFFLIDNLIVTFGTNCFVRYSWHVCYLGCPILGGLTVLFFFLVEAIIPSSFENFLKLPNFTRSYVLSRSATREATFLLLIIAFRVTFGGRGIR